MDSRSIRQPAGDLCREQLVAAHNPRSALQAIVQRPLQHLQHAGKKYRGLWAEMDRLRARRAEGRGWPAWCLLPTEVTYEAALALGRHITFFEMAALSALFTWRITQGVYCFDQTIFDELWSTSITGNIPSEALEGLPEWGCYITSSFPTSAASVILMSTAFS
jgi:hypothetical protein